MTMDHPQHPDDERLAALAGADPEATGDPALRGHVAACDRCASVVAELTTLRSALASLPDLAPSRPLRLLPPVEEAPASFADRLAAFVRRGFAPALVAGAGLALVGAIGTANPTGILPQAASGPGADSAGSRAAATDAAAPAPGAAEEAPAAEAATASPEPADGTSLFEAAGGSPAGEEGDRSIGTETETEAAVIAPAATPETVEGGGAGAAADEATAEQPVEALAERSPWPMVLFAGVALIVAALLLRWILQPRAG
jgi:hypothetical protein